MQVVERYLDELKWISENPTTTRDDTTTLIHALKNVILNEIATEREQLGKFIKNTFETALLYHF
jgi:hypothetical protein